MRKIILLSLLAWGISFSAAALAVPDGKAAVVEAVIGKVSADQGQGYKKLKLGQDLAQGASVKTGANGRVSLRLPDGSAARIASNTEMTLKAPEARKGVFTRLLTGTVRFLVAKQTAGRSFETELPSSVAAVKGTDPEYSTDGKVSTAKVFSSGNPVALLFTDTKSGKETSLKAGEKLTFDGDSFKLEKLDDKDREESDKSYQGLPEAKTEGGGEAKEGDGGAQGGEAASSSGSTNEQSSDQGMEEVTQEAMQEAMGDLYLDGFLERDERTGDIAAGKIVFDRFGERVQVTHLITRPDESSVSISSYSLRDSGPNAGVSLAMESATFNQALPEDWGSVWHRKLDDAANLDGSGYPIYFRTSQFFMAANPAGDSVIVNTLYDAPDWIGIQGGPLEQGFASDLYVNGQQGASIFAHDTFAATNGNVSPFGIMAGSAGYASWSYSAVPFEGGWSFTFNSGGVDILTQDLHFLDDNGNVLAHPTFAGTPPFPNIFKGFDANVELALRSPLFEGRSIDLIFLPGFFDLYDILDTGGIPYYTGG